MKGASRYQDELDLAHANSNDLIRSGSIKSPKSNGSLEMESTAGGASPAALRRMRKHSWTNSACLGVLTALTLTALGLAIWGAVEGVNNGNDIDGLNQDIQGLESQIRAVAAAGGSSLPAGAAVVPSSGSPDALLSSSPQPPKGYAYAGSAFRGAGYWATRPSIQLDVPRSHHQAVTNGSLVYLCGGRTFDVERGAATTASCRRFDSVLGLYGDMPAMPAPRYMHAAAMVERKLYVVGGWPNGDAEQEREPSGSAFVYSAQSNTWDEVASPDKARAGACAAAVGDRLYLVGGYVKGGGATDSIEAYDAAADEWREVGKLPSARGFVGCAAVGSKLYIAGGSALYTATDRSGALSETLSFDAESGDIEQLAPMASGARQLVQLVPTNDADGSLLAVGGRKMAFNSEVSYWVGSPAAEAYLPSHDVWVARAPLDVPRLGGAAAGTPSGVFVFGGDQVCEQESGRCRSLRSVEVLELGDVPDVFVHLRTDAAADGPGPATDIVLSGQHRGALYDANGAEFRPIGSLFQGSGYWARTNDNMPMGDISDMQVIPVRNSVGVQSGAYMVGGQNKDGVTGRAWVYDAVLHTWRPRADMPEPRSQHAAALVGGKLYVVGGFTTVANVDEGNVARTMLVYDLASDTWEVHPEAPQTPRSNACMAAVGGKLYLAGGYAMGWNGTVPTVEVFDPADGSWAVLAALPTPRGDPLCASLDNRLVVLGGYHDPSGEWAPNSFRDEVEALDPATGQWAALARLPVKRGDMALVELPNARLMVMGGETVDNLATRTMVASNEVHEYIAALDLWVRAAPMVEERFRFDAAFLDGSVYVFGGQGSTDKDGTPRGLATIEAFHYTQNPDVFLWRKVPGQ